jgi:anaerobic ribonucleoside-triphosphate reductase
LALTLNKACSGQMQQSLEMNNKEMITTTQQVTKRDGTVVEFDKLKIVNAILKAMVRTEKGVDMGVANGVADKVESKLSKKKEPHDIEMIQNLVEYSLMQSNRKDVAQEYIRYRFKRDEERNSVNNIDKEIQGLFDFTSEEVVNNANKAGDKLQTFRAMISDIACKDYAKRRIVPRRFNDAHEEGSIYIHDYNYLAIPFFNCMLINWIDMLENGFEVGNTIITTPKGITTAIALLSQIVAHVSSNCYGGVTLPSLDIGLEPYAKKSYAKHLRIGMKWLNDEEKAQRYAWERLEKELYDAAQAFEYEIQTLTNSRGEVPFVTIEFGIGEGEFCKLIQKSFLYIRFRGFEDDLTPVFPKICFGLKRGFNLDPEDPNHDVFQLAVKCSSKRLYPDYINFDKLVETTGDYKAPMSCRSFLPLYNDEFGNNKTLGRFNFGVCTINLTRLALKAEGNEKGFYKLLNKYLELTKEVLLFRQGLLKGVKARQAPILYCNGAVSRLNPEETIDHLLENSYSTASIGYLGLYNCMNALYGESFLGNEEMLQKGIAIIQYMREYADKLKKETGIGFSIYSTPAEVYATKACKKDIQDFGVIDGVTNLGYYENSFHVPATYEISPFKKIDVEANFAKIASGGAIQYVQFGSMIHNTEALETIIRYAYDKTHYFGVNVSSDACLSCGYRGEIKPQTIDKNDYVCPQCGNNDKSKLSVVRRVSGYLGSFSERPTIDMKMKEIHSRVKHYKGK